MSNHQFYSTQEIFRSVELRKLNTKRFNRKRRIIAIWEDQVFIDREKGIDIFLDFSALPSFLQKSWELYFLGIEAAEEIYCLDLSGLEINEAQLLLGKGKFIAMRDIAGQITKKQAAFIGYAKGMAGWNRRNIYCSVCGSLMDKADKGHLRKCSSLKCGKIIYPRIDSAVIVIIEHRPQNHPPLCLLNRRITEAGYECSPFAGFVEIGESLEDTVRREMLEEVNVEVENIKYVASQPWPFPSSLMIGMIAETEKKDFRVDNLEITDAHWYTASEIREQVNNGTMVLSKSDSIARYLIENWVINSLTMYNEKN